MKIKLTILLALITFSSSALAIEYYLRADVTTKIMPDGAVITMWGFAKDSAMNTDDGVVTVPGPMLEVPLGDPNLIIHLKNDLTAASVGQMSEPVSIVIPGQLTAFGPARFDQTNPLYQGRMRSFTTEALPGGPYVTYSWTNFKPGSYVYHSGTHQAVQVQMGLYGGVTKDIDVNVAYPPDVNYTKAVPVFYSEIDPTLHTAVANNNYGPAKPVTSTIDYTARYFLVNGQPFSGDTTPLATIDVGQKLLLRFFNMGLKGRYPMLDGMHMLAVAEDGNPYRYPTEQYVLNLSAGRTMDAIITPTVPGTYSLIDRALGLANNITRPGGMISFIVVTGQQNVPTVPDAPTSLNAVVINPHQVNLTWTDNSDNETGFRLERAIGAGVFAVIQTLAANATAFNDTAAPDGSTLNYRVIAFNDVGDSLSSNTATIATPLVAPSNAAAVMSSRPPLTVTVTWTDNSTSETGFAIQRATNAAFTTGVTNFTAASNATSFVNNLTFSSNITYYYRVRATIGTAFSAWSNTAQVRIAPPAAPSGLTATLGANPLRISLAWNDNSTVEAGHQIQRALNSAFTSSVTNFEVAANIMVYTDNSVLPNVRYYYRVRAFNGVNNSGWSNSVNLLTPGTTPAITIIDNGQAGTSSTGTWQTSTAPNPYGTNSLWSYNGATYTWSFTPTVTGTYRVSMWWTALASRYTAVPVRIWNGGTVANLTINQTQNGGVWNVLGQYTFTAGTTYRVTMTATPTNSPPSTCADAVRFERL
ncbi:MAG: hypothetical protein A2Y07_09035 [Planctomycetes bacterium GWF2_50_10]|nr:MAG: hypothetical protein A2Y07_09035 [Planctomycetes bacterium GWF2_50_10]